jgi:hypothetical protein
VIDVEHQGTAGCGPGVGHEIPLIAVRPALPMRGRSRFAFTAPPRGATRAGDHGPAPSRTGRNTCPRRAGLSRRAGDRTNVPPALAGGTPRIHRVIQGETHPDAASGRRSEASLPWTPVGSALTESHPGGRSMADRDERASSAPGSYATLLPASRDRSPRQTPENWRRKDVATPADEVRLAGFRMGFPISEFGAWSPGGSAGTVSCPPDQE